MLQRPLIVFTRKSVRQTFWWGIALIAAAVVWLIAAVQFTPAENPDDAWISVVPFILLLLAGGIFLAAWVWFLTFRLTGFTGTEDDGTES